MELLYDYRIAFLDLIVRLILGVLLINQGYDKLFRIGVERSSVAATDALHSLKLSKGIVKFIVLMTSVIEFAGGILLIIGWLIVPASYAVAAGLLPVVIAMSMREPLWNAQHVMVRLALVGFIIISPEPAHVFALDHLF